MNGQGLYDDHFWSFFGYFYRKEPRILKAHRWRTAVNKKLTTGILLPYYRWSRILTYK